MHASVMHSYRGLRTYASKIAYVYRTYARLRKERDLCRMLQQGDVKAYSLSATGTHPHLPPRLYSSQLKLLLDLATREGCKAELTQLAWLHTKVVYRPEDGLPCQN